MESEDFFKYILYFVLKSLGENSQMYLTIHTQAGLLMLDGEYLRTHSDPKEWETEILWRGGTIVVYDLVTPRKNVSLGYGRKTWFEGFSCWRYVIDLKRCRYAYDKLGGDPPFIDEETFKGTSFTNYAIEFMQITLYDHVEYKIPNKLWRKK